MTVVPVAFQLASWIPAWWRGAVGGDDIVSLTGPVDLTTLLALSEATVALTAYSPELGVGVLPGPKPTTEAAVAAGQAVIVHRGPAESSCLLIPEGDRWTVHDADPTRPLDLSMPQAETELARAVVAAEHGLRETATRFTVEYRSATVRALPPGAAGPRHALLSRAVRVWTALEAVPQELRTEPMDQALTAAARATLAAYMEHPVGMRQSRASHRRLA